MAAFDPSARPIEPATQSPSALQRAAEARRRKVRKGTHSCWECRRRKIRCQYTSLDDVVCIGCHARGSACRSQEFADDAPPPPQLPPERKVVQRLDRLESMMEQLMTHVMAAVPAAQGAQGQAPAASTVSNGEQQRQGQQSQLGTSTDNRSLEDAKTLAELFQRDPEEVVARVCPTAAARRSEAYKNDVLETSTADDTPVAALLGIQESLARDDNNARTPPSSTQHSSPAQDSSHRDGTSDGMATGSTPSTTAASSSAAERATATLPSPMASQLAPSIALDTPHERELSRMLHTLFPVQEDIDIITAGATVHFIVTLFHSQHDIAAGRGEPPASLAEVPPVTSHPMVLARRLLQLAICMQQMAPCIEQQRRLHLKDPVPQVIRRIAAVVSHTVTSSDDLIGSVEGLECLVLLGQLQANAGQLRRAWLTYRRAMSLAQLMGLDRGHTRALKSCNPQVDPRHRPTAAALWYRINAGDRHLSLLLGLQAGWMGSGASPDSQIAVFAANTDTPVERLEKAHTALTGCIIERNYNGTTLEDGYEATMAIDRSLRAAAARDLDAAWWRVLSYDPRAEPAYVLRELARCVLQVHHHCMLILLHLPYMLRSAQPAPTGAAASRCPAEAKKRLPLSKATCMQSSRAVLERFLQFRVQVSAAFSSRHVDYATLIAAMTLIIGYLGPRPAASAAPHVHDTFDRQLRRDQAMVQQVRDRMAEIGHANDDKLSLESAATIQKLVPILDLVGRRLGDGAVPFPVPVPMSVPVSVPEPSSMPCSTGFGPPRTTNGGRSLPAPDAAYAETYGFGDGLDGTDNNLDGLANSPMSAVRLDVPYFGTVNIYPSPEAPGRHWSTSPGLPAFAQPTNAPDGLYGGPPSDQGTGDAMLPWPGASPTSSSSLLLAGLLPEQQQQQQQQQTQTLEADFNAMLVDFDPMPAFCDGSSGSSGSGQMNSNPDGLAPGDGMFAFGTTPAFPDITGASDDWVMQGVDTTYWSLLNGGTSGFFGGQAG